MQIPGGAPTAALSGISASGGAGGAGGPDAPGPSAPPAPPTRRIALGAWLAFHGLSLDQPGYRSIQMAAEVVEKEMAEAEAQQGGTVSGCWRFSGRLLVRVHYTYPVLRVVRMVLGHASPHQNHDIL